jgi:hypothetical protein
MWILKKNKYLMDNFNSRALSKISYIYTFDFSKHYTTIPHMKNKFNLRLNEIIHKSFYWKAMFQFSSFWSNINLLCHVENERLKVLHRKLSHQYVGVPYR